MKLDPIFIFVIGIGVTLVISGVLAAAYYVLAALAAKIPAPTVTHIARTADPPVSWCSQRFPNLTALYGDVEYSLRVPCPECAVAERAEAGNG